MAKVLLENLNYIKWKKILPVRKDTSKLRRMMPFKRQKLQKWGKKQHKSSRVLRMRKDGSGLKMSRQRATNYLKNKTLQVQSINIL